MQKRGVFFSGDALVALLIIFFVLLVVFPVKENVRVVSEAHQDILNSLSVLKVGEVDDGYVSALISSGVITDLNKSLLEQIGEFSVTDPDLARDVAESVLGDLNLTGNIGVWYGSVLVYSSNKTEFENAEDVDTARLILSGIKEGESITGFSARAFLSSNLINDYFYFGGYVGDGNISVNVPYEGNISSAELELTVNNNFELYINGVFQGTYTKSASEFTPVNYALNTSDFVSGNNVIELRGNNLHVAGGFFRISYKPDVSFSDDKKYNFPGINGLINLYDGFYIPGDLEGIDIFLHINSSNTSVFLNLGNVSVFNSTTNGEETIVIDDATLGSMLDYSELSRKTIPIRFGMKNVTFLGIEQDIDVFSVTDLSGSMCGTCSGGGFLCCFFGGPCNNNQLQCEDCGGSCSNPAIDTAKQANNLFIDSILNSSNDNKVGLVGYKGSVSSGDVHALSNDSTSLKNEVNSWSAGGWTCICCGINRAVDDLLAQSDTDKFRSIVVMSDGQATHECAQQNTGDPSQDAIEAACDAYNISGITVHAIGFGENVDEATLQQIASCGNGDYYFSAVDELVDIYEQVAQNIIAEYIEQTIDIVGDLHARLFEDSYIQFDYEQQNIPVGLIITLEKIFDDDYSGNFFVESDSSILETRVTSYSGPRWTANVGIDGNSVYNLSTYGSDYIKLGDPYIVNIPNSLVGGGEHIVNLTTGVAPDNSTQGSDSNKIIYTIVKNASSFSPILSTADGCDWSIEFEDDSVVNSAIPKEYLGSESCYYNSSFSDGLIVDNNDAYQVAVLNLLGEMDVDSNGKVDFLFTQEDLAVSLDEVAGIPFTWSSEVQARRWY